VANNKQLAHDSSDDDGEEYKKNQNANDAATQLLIGAKFG
jgi:hypothetical protein